MAAASLKLVYFAWVRERIGVAEETVELPAGVATVAELVAWLKTRGEGYDHAFENPGGARRDRPPPRQARRRARRRPRGGVLPADDRRVTRNPA